MNLLFIREIMNGLSKILLKKQFILICYTAVRYS